MISTQQTNIFGLIEELQYFRSELHGFEIDMCGRVIVPEFHPRTADELAAYFSFESELRSAMDAEA